MIDSIVLESKFSNLEQLNGFIKISNFLVSKISFDFYQTTNIYTGLIKSEIPFFQYFSKKEDENSEKFEENISTRYFIA